MLSASEPGCSILADANAKHTSGGEGCNDDGSVVWIDVLLAGAAVGTLYLTGKLDSPGYYAIPAVFVASGTIGYFITRRCERRMRGLPDHPGPAKPIRLPDQETLPPEPAAGSANLPPRRACSIEPLVECPEGQSCLAPDGNTGYCVPDV
jgi:hypothetical protein